MLGALRVGPTSSAISSSATTTGDELLPVLLDVGDLPRPARPPASSVDDRRARRTSMVTSLSVWPSYCGTKRTCISDDTAVAEAGGDDSGRATLRDDDVTVAPSEPGHRQRRSRARAGVEPIERDRARRLDREEVLLVFVDADRAQARRRRRGVQRRSAIRSVAARRRACAARNSGTRLARDEDEDAEHRDDDRDAAERDDDDGGAIDAPQAADPLGRGGHLRCERTVRTVQSTQGAHAIADFSDLTPSSSALRDRLARAAACSRP